jgi:ribosomal protein S18 acetylase RimI-like enzyme
MENLQLSKNEYSLVCSEDNLDLWEFIRTLRNNESVQHGFIQKSNITPDQQKKYMSERGKNYFVCFLDKTPVGFIGDVESDIRICVIPEFQNMGIGTWMINNFSKLYPCSLAKVKIENKQSLRSFEKAGYKIKYYLLQKEEE